MLTTRYCFVACQYLVVLRVSFFQALDLSVMLMEMGEKALIHTDAKYAYGTRGRYVLI